MTLTMPNPNPPESVAEIVFRLKNDKDFAAALATEVKKTMSGDANAIAIVEAYFQPTARDLTSFGIPAADQTAMRSCTEVSKLILAPCKEAAPQVFL